MSKQTDSQETRVGWIDVPAKDVSTTTLASGGFARHARHGVDVPVPGTVLAGKYRIEALLGTGGMAVVAAAYHLQLQRRVALKYLVGEVLGYPEIVARFMREARVAATIRGEHVARVIDVGVFDGGAPFIVLEYLEGMDLAQHVLSEGPVSVVDAVRYILETCEALAEAHAAHIVHRDLKPANLFLARGPDRRETIKVLDFGVSKLMDEPMTDPSRMLGTVAYMSPEQLRGSSSVDLRTDIWSLGIILYELLGGESPFGGSSVVEVARAIIENAPKPLSSERRDLPTGLEDVITRCLRTNPDERYASVLELASDLAPFATKRDRESVRTIRGVLCGSLAPPPNTPAEGLATAPTIPPPAPLPSDAPVTTGLLSQHPSTIAPRAPDATPRQRSWTPWLLAVLVTAGVAVAGRMSTAPAAAPAVLAPSEISVRITSTTANARARIDDGPLVPLPLEKSVPRDDREHTIRVEAPGFVSRSKSVRFANDLVMALVLSSEHD
jgi:eukaryotic-like serine/threonine-protein kinase